MIPQVHVLFDDLKTWCFITHGKKLTCYPAKLNWWSHLAKGWNGIPQWLPIIFGDPSMNETNFPWVKMTNLWGNPLRNLVFPDQSNQSPKHSPGLQTWLWKEMFSAFAGAGSRPPYLLEQTYRWKGSGQGLIVIPFSVTVALRDILMCLQTGRKSFFCGRRNAFASFSNDELHFSCQAQGFGDFHRHFAWHSTLHTLHSTLRTLKFTTYTLHSTFYILHSTLYTPHSTLYTPHSTTYNLHSTLYTLHSTLNTLHSTLFTLHSTLYTPHSTLHTLHSTLYPPHCALHTPHFTLYTPQFTLHTLHYTPHSTLYTPHFTLHTPHFTLHTPHSTLYTPHATL